MVIDKVVIDRQSEASDEKEDLSARTAGKPAHRCSRDDVKRYIHLSSSSLLGKVTSKSYFFRYTTQLYSTIMTTTE